MTWTVTNGTQPFFRQAMRPVQKRISFVFDIVLFVIVVGCVMHVVLRLVLLSDRSWLSRIIQSLDACYICAISAALSALARLVVFYVWRLRRHDIVIAGNRIVCWLSVIIDLDLKTCLLAIDSLAIETPCLSFSLWQASGRWLIATSSLRAWFMPKINREPPVINSDARIYSGYPWYLLYCGLLTLLVIGCSI